MHIMQQNETWHSCQNDRMDSRMSHSRTLQSFPVTLQSTMENPQLPRGSILINDIGRDTQELVSQSLIQTHDRAPLRHATAELPSPSSIYNQVGFPTLSVLLPSNYQQLLKY